MDEVTNLKHQLKTVNKRNADIRMQLVTLMDILKYSLAQIPEFEKKQED